MKRLILAAVASSLCLPAAAEAVTTAPVLVELRKWCLAEPESEGVSRPVPYCNCVMGQGWRWVNAATGAERQSRLFTLMVDLQPTDLTQDKLYAEAVKENPDLAAPQKDMVRSYRAIDALFTACDPGAD